MYDLNKILDEIKILPKWDTAICLQGTETIKDPFAGIGSARDLPEKEVNAMVVNRIKVKKYLTSKIIKTIFVKNKIINYILPKK